MRVEKPQILGSGDLFPFFNTRRVDAYTGGLAELFFIDNPQYSKNNPESREKMLAYVADMKQRIKPVGIYLPWHNTVIFSLPEDLYFRLRTARNRHLITETEQMCYRNLNVGVAGLSVGSSVLQALTISGGPKNLRIADFDTIELTNLNRIKARLIHVGSNKAHVAAMEVWDIDPFADIQIFDHGLNSENILDFVVGRQKLDVLVDEMDNLAYKALARKICRENRVPVVMATDNGDDVILDIERFDLEPDRPLFHGSVSEGDLDNLTGMDRRKWIELSTRIIDPDFMTSDLQKSILEISKTISGVPQLGTTGAVAGAVVAFVIRRMANEYQMPSGRYVISLEDKLIPGHDEAFFREARLARSRIFKKTLLGDE